MRQRSKKTIPPPKLHMQKNYVTSNDAYKTSHTRAIINSNNTTLLSLKTNQTERETNANEPVKQRTHDTHNRRTKRYSTQQPISQSTSPTKAKEEKTLGSLPRPLSLLMHPRASPPADSKLAYDQYDASRSPHPAFQSWQPIPISRICLCEREEGVRSNAARAYALAPYPRHTSSTTQDHRFRGRDIVDGFDSTRCTDVESRLTFREHISSPPPLVPTSRHTPIVRSTNHRIGHC
jgi:hypothetical protein